MNDYPIMKCISPSAFVIINKRRAPHSSAAAKFSNYGSTNSLNTWEIDEPLHENTL